MTRPTARVLALLELLQAGGVRTVGSLAERLGVDERTVRRDVAHLLELEVPVETVRGRYGGYRVGAGYRLPPLMLTDDEAVAAVLGLAHVARTAGAGPVRTAAETADAKLRRVLPDRLRSRLPALEDVRSTASAPRAPAVAAEVLLVATAAARDRRPLRIRYRGRDGASRRVVLPWGVVEHGGRWYLVGPDSASDEVRTFRLDRVESAEPGTGRFRVPEGEDPVRRVLAGLAAAPREHTVRVLVRADEETVRRHLPPAAAVLEPVPEADAGGAGWLRVRLEAEHLGWVAGVLALLDAPFRVEEPAALRDEVRALAGRLAARA